MGNSQIDFLTLNKLRFWLFLLKTFVVFWGQVVYNMLFYNITDIFLKVQFWISSNTNYCNRWGWFYGYITDLQYMWACVFYDNKLKNITICFNWILRKPYTFSISCLRLENMLSKFIPHEQRLLSSAKLQISDFAEKKNKSLIKILKSKGLSIELCGIPFKIFVQPLNVETIWILCVRFVRWLKNNLIPSVLKP